MIHTAQVSWSADGQPHSAQFEDVYFSRAGGVAECEAVFLAGNRLPERWQGCSRFTIGETGFGSGLNFLTTCHHFIQTTHTETLRFISVEKYPLTPQDLSRIHTLLPPFLQDWATRLQQLMPPALAGWHYLRLHERIALWLYIGDAVTGLADLESSIGVDAWFLDGFSPAKNPQMWSQGLFFQLSRLSAPTATLSTFTAASAVRKGLTLAGFSVTKVKGFAGKRERMIAVHQHASKFQRSHHKAHLPLQAQPLPKGSQIAVIGAGIAGATVATQLAQAGMHVTVYEQNTQPAQAASGNLAGIVMPVLDRQHGFYAQWYWQAWRTAIDWLAAQSDTNLGQVSGVLTWQKQAQRQQELIDWVNQLNKSDWLRTVSNGQTELPAILVAQAGWLSPVPVVTTLLDHPNIRLECQMHITRLTQDGDAWQLQAVERKTFTHDAVVIACGAGIQQLLPNWMPHLQIQKGQVAHLAASAWQGQLPTMPWMFDGYVMPAVAERICIGATFEKDAPLGITADGISHNLNTLANALPAHQYHPHQIIGGHSAYRMMTRDHLPLVGSLPNLDCYQQGVQPCVQRPDTCPDMARCLHPHLYLSIGHGSRGLSSSFLAAQVIAAQITGQTAPIGLRLSQAVHPARVLFRELTA